jgi:hypothetical protein
MPTIPCMRLRKWRFRKTIKIQLSISSSLFQQWFPLLREVSSFEVCEEIEHCAQ